MTHLRWRGLPQLAFLPVSENIRREYVGHLADAFLIFRVPREDPLRADIWSILLYRPPQDGAIDPVTPAAGPAAH